MDLWNELAIMASAALDDPGVEPEHDDIERWQVLFGYSHAEAAQKIRDHRSNLSRTTVPESHWEMVRIEKEAKGYDREAYEHSCNMPKSRAPAPMKQPKRLKPSTYLFRLQGPLSDPDRVKSVGQLSLTPATFNGTDDCGRPALFCKIDESTKDKLSRYLSEHEPHFQPTFVRYSKAEKCLSSSTCHPTLGCDATLPQNRPTTADDSILLPTQDQYPVWYFFYGTLADPCVIKSLLGITPIYKKASVHGGTLTSWGGKFRALIDAPGNNQATILGSAFLVINQEQEDVLQCYETDTYEVVRCTIYMEEGEKVRGLTFRFVSTSDELTGQP